MIAIELCDELSRDALDGELKEQKVLAHLAQVARVLQLALHDEIARELALAAAARRN